MDLNPYNYPKMGISHDFSWLSTIGTRILWYPQIEQAKLADAISRRYADNKEFNEMQSGGEIDIPAPQLGNVAYMALHSHPDYIEGWNTIYNDWMTDLTRRYKADYINSERDKIGKSLIPEPFETTAAYSLRRKDH